MSDGSPVSYNDMFISHGVAKTVIFHWSRSGNSSMTYSSHYVYSSAFGSQVEPSDAHGVSYDHFCGRRVVTVVTAIVFGVHHLVEFHMMYTVVQVMSSELPLMIIIYQ